VLVTQNYITDRDLKEALHVQVSQLVFRVFRWRDGEYHFAPQDQVEYDRENFNPMSADFILMEGIRMVDEWPIIEKKIPSMDIVFRSAVDASMIEVGAGDDDGGDVLSGLGAGPKRSAASASNKIRLTAEEEKIYRKVDGTRTVQGVIDATGIGEFEVCRTLFDFLNRNLISTAGRGAAKEAATGRVDVAMPSAPGYAAVAIVALVALVSAAAHLRSPFAVLGLSPLLKAPYDIVLDGIGQARLDRLDRAIQAYHLVHGSVPKTLEDLVGDKLVDRSYLKDPWSRPFHYALTESGYLLNAVDESGKTVAGSSIERLLPADKP
jgi:hypothetical protein